MREMLAALAVVGALISGAAVLVVGAASGPDGWVCPVCEDAHDNGGGE